MVEIEEDEKNGMSAKTLIILIISELEFRSYTALLFAEVLRVGGGGRDQSHCKSLIFGRFALWTFVLLKRGIRYTLCNRNMYGANVQARGCDLSSPVWEQYWSIRRRVAHC